MEEMDSCLSVATKALMLDPNYPKALYFKAKVSVVSVLLMLLVVFAGFVVWFLVLMCSCWLLWCVGAGVGVLLLVLVLLL